MKVLHITNAYPTKNYGAFGVFIQEQIESLNDLGIENDVFFINAYEKGNIEYLKAIFKLIAGYQKYDIIHCHHSYSGIAYLLSSFNSKPLVFSNLGDINKQRRKIDRFFFNIISKIAKAVIYKNSMKVKKKNIDKFHYLPNGVNTEFFKQYNKDDSKIKLDLDINKDYALFVSASGKKARIKRYDKFEKALELATRQGIVLEPLIVSGVERSKVPVYFNAASIMLLTSDHEGSPNAVKEALACNLSVVSTDVGNVSEMLEGCSSSFVARSNSAEELSELIKKSFSITEHNERDQIHEKKLDMKSVARKLVNIYNDILN